MLNANMLPQPIQDWLHNFEENFYDTILANVDSLIRNEITTCIQKQARLSPKLNTAVLNSLNFHTYNLGIPDVRKMQKTSWGGEGGS